MLINNYELFDKQRGGPRVCWVQTRHGAGAHGRKDGDDSAAIDSFGARAIRNELAYQYDIVSIDKMGDYDFALFSLTSVVEIENILHDIARYKPNKRQCKVIIGGMGCINIWPLIDFADIAVFGRGEGQINDIIEGARYPNVWRKEDDPNLEGRYCIRQAESLLPGEAGVGCPNRCAYCQYTHVRRWIRRDTGGYTASGLDSSSIYEDDWNRIKFRPGRNQTAWDGWSDDTRRRVHKPVTNELILRKLIALRESNFKATCNLKIYQIVGYPWETPDSLRRDLSATAELLRGADGTGGRIFIMFSITPLSPEPLTPLQADDVTFHDWRTVINEWDSPTHRARQVYKGQNIEAMILPQIPGIGTLQRRIALNRSDRANYGKVVDWITSGAPILSDFYEQLDAHWRGQTDFLYMPVK